MAVLTFRRSSAAGRSAGRAVSLTAFFRWWGQGLLACLPASVRRWLSGSAPHLILKLLDDGEIALLQERQEKVQEIERYSGQRLADGELARQVRKAKNHRLVLRLPAAKVLSKTLSLPLAAEANLHQVVGFEIDRLTPFKAEQVYYDAYVLERRSELRRLLLKLVATPRGWVDEWLNRLAAVQIVPDVIDVSGEPGAVNLLPPAQRPRKGKLAQRLQWTLAVLALVLIAAASILPLWQHRSLIVRQLLPETVAAQQQAERVLSLRNALDSALESSRFLAQKRQQLPLIIDLLNELTKILPDSTWIERLEVKGDELHLRGQSSEASNLIALVEASKFFQGATFRSPVTNDSRTGKDRFYLFAKIARES